MTIQSVRYTVELPNNGHTGSRDLVLYREVVPTRRLTSKPHPSIPRLNLLRGVACGRSNQWFYPDTFRIDPRWSKSTKRKINRLSRCSWVTILLVNCIACSFDLCLLSKLFCTVYSHLGTHIYLSIIRSLEVVRISEVEKVLVLW